MRAAAAALALAIGAGTASAAVLGTPAPDSSLPVPSPSTDTTYSTNQDNYDSGLFYVEQVGSSAGEVTLQFVNPLTSITGYFEIRIDNAAATSSTDHYFIPGEKVYPFIVAGPGSSPTQTFSGSSFVDVRQAFGPEQDYFFDWTRFEIPPASPIPLPAGLPLLAAGLGAFGLVRLRRSQG